MAKLHHATFKESDYDRDSEVTMDKALLFITEDLRKNLEDVQILTASNPNRVVVIWEDRYHTTRD